MEFDAFGDVQACCANSLYPLGNVASSTLEDIWWGERAETLRSAVAAGDLSHGCHVCRHRLTYGHGDLARDYYDHFPLPTSEPAWPYSLQFSLHNTCNLACVMCGADRSSKIRATRTDLAPLPRVYGDRFFREIKPFIEHAGAVDLSGGEPFLIAEHGRIWDLLIELSPDRRPLCSLTTNGTVWNERTERVLAELDTHITVSIDGVTPATFEAIRLGADFHEVIRNLDRFLDYTRSRGTILTLGWSLLQQNWFELGAAARFAEERGIVLKVHTVIEPDFGIQQLPTDELHCVVSALEREAETLVPDLELNRGMFLREVDRLREELELRDQPGLRARCMEPPRDDNVAHVIEMILGSNDRRPDDIDLALVVDNSVTDLRGWCEDAEILQVEIDSEGVVAASDGFSGVLAGVAVNHGELLAALLERLEAAFDAHLWIAEEHHRSDRLEHTLWFGREVRDKAGVVVRLTSIPGPVSTVVLAGSSRQFLPGDGTGAVPVTLSSGRRTRSDQSER